ncbi:hypothetical protein [Gracilimonas mengyeensis]|uniref:Lipoprotein n=1 Tax=Gracilimonas mengyeensis TaxID=1302730 RepID=A0A521C3Q0_9BACT|nr:hypothetical protein [Gracilimonas mengyeensis]SMO53350.1 hypothetical protein SAMN06265219_10487 [Gracilimonas mengyeensis]
MRKLFLLFVPFVILTGCIQSSQIIEPFSVTAELDYKGPLIGENLQIVLHQEIPDTLSMIEEYSEVTFRVADYRNSLGQSLKKTFAKSFKEVKLGDSSTKDGYVLMINKAELSPVSSLLTFNSNRQHYMFLSYTYNFVLMKDGTLLKKGQASGKSKSHALSTIYYPNLVRSTVKEACGFIAGDMMGQFENKPLISERN